MATDQAQSAARDAASQVQEKAQDVQSQAAEKAREQLDTRSTELGEQVHSLGGALRQSAEQLDGEGKESPARLARQAADQVERFGGYLKDSNADRFLGDVEGFARRRPWAAGGIGAVLGFVASRFLKASSDQRYQSARQSTVDSEAPLSRDGFGEVGTEAMPALPPVERRVP